MATQAYQWRTYTPAQYIIHLVRDRHVQRHRPVELTFITQDGSPCYLRRYTPVGKDHDTILGHFMQWLHHIVERLDRTYPNRGRSLARAALASARAFHVMLDKYNKNPQLHPEVEAHLLYSDLAPLDEPLLSDFVRRSYNLPPVGKFAGQMRATIKWANRHKDDKVFKAVLDRANTVIGECYHARLWGGSRCTPADVAGLENHLICTTAREYIRLLRLAINHARRTVRKIQALGFCMSHVYDP